MPSAPSAASVQRPPDLAVCTPASTCGANSGAVAASSKSLRCCNRQGGPHRVCGVVPVFILWRCAHIAATKQSGGAPVSTYNAAGECTDAPHWGHVTWPTTSGDNAGHGLVGNPTEQESQATCSPSHVIDIRYLGEVIASHSSSGTPMPPLDLAQELLGHDQAGPKRHLTCSHLCVRKF